MELYKRIALVVKARLGCLAKNGDDLTYWVDMGNSHEERAEKLVKDFMPSGSGFDNGTTLDFERSNENQLVFQTSYHHMDEFGGYNGWTEYMVTVNPSFIGLITVAVSGRNINDIKSFIEDTFHEALIVPLAHL